MVKNHGSKQRVQRTLWDCWQWEFNGQRFRGHNGCFRHDFNKRGKSSPSKPSPNSFMQLSDRKSSRTRSTSGRSPSGRTSRWPCKDYFRGTSNNLFCEKWPIWEFSIIVSIFHFFLGINWCCVCCLSIATRQSGDDIHDLGCCHLRCWRSLFSEHCTRSWIVLYNITTEYNSTFVFFGVLPPIQRFSNDICPLMM